MAPEGGHAGAKQHPIPATKAASEARNYKPANIVVLGAPTTCSNSLSQEALGQVISEWPTKRAEQSIRALEMGVELGRQLGES